MFKKTLMVFFGGIVGTAIAISPTFATDMLVALRSSLGTYLTAEGGGGGEVRANRPEVGPWETFKLFDLSAGDLNTGDRICLRTQNGSNYLRVDREKLDAEGEACSPDAMFVIIKVDGSSSGTQINACDSIALRGVESEQYVSAEGGGGTELSVDRYHPPGSWETFIFGGQPNNPGNATSCK
ncbi:MAG: hypothetical protein AAGA60_12030 [Cyanobacteria bacterium P01_E01_bin.42]